MSKIAISSKSLSENRALHEVLARARPGIRFNDSGKHLVGNELVEFLQGAETAITGLERIDAALLEKVPTLRHVAKYGVGLDMLDLEAMTARGVTLGWQPGVNRRAVAELTLTFALLSLRLIPEAHRHLTQGEFAFPQGRQLTGRIFGIIGLGNVGQELVQFLKPFGCTILAHDIRDRSEFCARAKIVSCDLDTLLLRSDIVSIHVPRNPRTLGLMNAARISRMKKGSVLINTARGGLIDEAAWLEALKNEHLFAGAADVFEEEPPRSPAALELIRHPRFFGTPHLGGGTVEAREAMGLSAIACLEIRRKATDYLEYQ